MHTFTKRVTFTPLSKGKYRCNQTGRVLTQREILSCVSGVLAGHEHAIIGRKGPNAPPKKAKGSDTAHPSKYRAKHR
jgi:hypothetical protein